MGALHNTKLLGLSILAMDFYIVQLPIITRGNSNHTKPKTMGNELTFMHGNGCKDWGDCLTCQKKDCDWQAYPKPHRKVKANEGK